MTPKEFYDKTDIKALYDMPQGIVALKEEDLFKLMEDYAKQQCIDFIDWVFDNDDKFEAFGRGKEDGKSLIEDYLKKEEI